ncbi:MAG: cysteine desulfurase [Desulfuromonas sp.]|nr:MAG: cysteine desulfurase [Desulfuromonas sp.]
MSIYLDNSATSFPKPEAVYRAVDHAFRNYGANPGRGGHRMSVESARMVFDAREALADFFAVDDSARIILTSGATESINLALFGLLGSGDRVVTTTMEHNSVLRPLHALQDRGVVVEKVSADPSGTIAAADIIAACRKPTRLVVMTHCSNVTGSVQPVEQVAAYCRDNDILLLVDAAQSAGLLPISLRESGIDLLATAGHKGLMGPPGVGVLYVKPGLQLEPLIYGGTGTLSQSGAQPAEMPERFESGTLNTPGIAGLLAGVQYLNEIGLASVREHEQSLLQLLLDGLGSLDDVAIYGSSDVANHGGAVSFNCKNFDPAEIGFRLDNEYDIMVRVGLHCAPDAHRTIGSFPRGTVRVSPGYYNSTDDIEKLVDALGQITR